MDSEYLAIDVGGTKTATAVCKISNGKVIETSGHRTWQTRSQNSLGAIANSWATAFPGIKLSAVGIGVAGPVTGIFPNQKAEVTNVGWNLDASKLSRYFNQVPVFLCNDMESHGWGLLSLSGQQIHTLNKGLDRPGCKALIAAGTGLGESVIAWDGSRHVPLGGEGGHAGFSPFDETDDRLLTFLRRKLAGHVSWERALGGKDGFRNLAEFTAEEAGLEIPKNVKGTLNGADDWGAAIGSLAQAGDPFCHEVVAYYSLLYGREAANLAVKCMPYSGLYLGGGIAPRIIPWLEKYFMKGFTAKGRFSEKLAGFPVHIIMETENGLRGAALGAHHKLRHPSLVGSET